MYFVSSKDRFISNGFGRGMCLQELSMEIWHTVLLQGHIMFIYEARPQSKFPWYGQLARWRKWRACGVEEAREGLENELWRR